MRKLAILLLAAAAWSVSAKTPVRVTIEQNSIVAQVTPRAKTAWFSVSQEPAPYGRGVLSVHRAFLLEDDDGDGTVRLTLQHPPFATSVWMVVDLDSGEHAVMSPDAALLRHRSLPPSALVSRGNAKSARLLQEDLVSVFFVARPGVGAWIAKIRDGSAADGDLAVNGRISAAVDSMNPVGSSPAPPDDLKKDDVVAFANPLTLTLYDTRVVK